jgi:ABC-type multidrug transport system fused ATPase/permease subunit
VTAAYLLVYAMLGVGVVGLNAVKTVMVSLIGDILYIDTPSCKLHSGSICDVSYREGCVSCKGLRAAKNLHSNMLESLLRAPTAFFDQTPVGRMVNRFSSDMMSIDVGLVDMFLVCAAQPGSLITEMSTCLEVTGDWQIYLGVWLMCV